MQLWLKGTSQKEFFFCVLVYFGVFWDRHHRTPFGYFWDRFIINVPLVPSLIADVPILTQNQLVFYSVWQAFPLFLVAFHVTINYDNNCFREV